ncbi:hypothetical protein M885DRAFT_537456 [Pelagophyceae sp. CCMP2097]|nr:hypothetical protein M885DRAFT_537456 [Pelagophyceae sp. CCMP2097]
MHCMRYAATRKAVPATSRCSGVKGARPCTTPVSHVDSSFSHLPQVSGRRFDGMRALSGPSEGAAAARGPLVLGRGGRGFLSCLSATSRGRCHCSKFQWSRSPSNWVPRMLCGTSGNAASMLARHASAFAALLAREATHSLCCSLVILSMSFRTVFSFRRRFSPSLSSYAFAGLFEAGHISRDLARRRCENARIVLETRPERLKTSMDQSFAWLRFHDMNSPR